MTFAYLVMMNLMVPGIQSIANLFHINAAVNGYLELTLLKGRQRFDIES